MPHGFTTSDCKHFPSNLEAIRTQHITDHLPQGLLTKAKRVLVLSVLLIQMAFQYRSATQLYLAKTSSLGLFSTMRCGTVFRCKS